MSSKWVLIFIVFTFMSCRSSGQSKNLSDDILKRELRSYLKSEGELSIDDSVVLYVVNLLNFKEYENTPGVYKFGVLGAHYLPHIVYVKEDGFDILKDYKTIFVLESFTNFVKSSESRYTEIEQTQMLTNISGVLRNRMKIIDESSIEEEIDY